MAASVPQKQPAQAQPLTEELVDQLLAGRGVRGWLRAARVALGGPEQTKNRHRDARSFVWLDDLRRDMAYALRMLVRAPAFAAVAVITLALSIGAVTAIFSVVDHVLVRSLPLPHADRLVRLYESNQSAGRLKEDVSPPHAADDVPTLR